MSCILGLENIYSFASFVFLQNRNALLSLMVDVAVMLGAPKQAARAQLEKALDFETKVAHVKTKF